MRHPSVRPGWSGQFLAVDIPVDTRRKAALSFVGLLSLGFNL
jgi:hypothetical protein